MTAAERERLVREVVADAALEVVRRRRKAREAADAASSARRIVARRQARQARLTAAADRDAAFRERDAAYRDWSSTTSTAWERAMTWVIRAGRHHRGAGEVGRASLKTVRPPSR